jgi:flagellin-like hook-associated protein FlgL
MSTNINIAGIPTTRVSDLFIRQQMIDQLEAEQTQMAQTEAQLSSGYQFSVPSSDPLAAMQVIGLQSMLGRNTQVQTNLTSVGTYLSETGSALQSASNLITQARATAVGATGTNASAADQSAAVQEIQQATAQLVNIANTQFNGVYLFGGSNTSSLPFTTTASGAVEYAGNQNSFDTYGGLDMLLANNVSGAQAFGAVSPPIQGADLQPALGYDTPLADLNQGAGVAAGSIAISDGHTTSIVNLQGCQTIGDVAARIAANPPTGRALEVQVTGTGLVLSLDPDPAGGFPASQDNLSVHEVGGGTTAADLGIFQPNGVGDGPLVGNALDPALTTDTALDRILGTPAMSFLQMGGPNNDIVLTANSVGAAAADGTLLNGVKVQFVDNAPAAGQESAQFDPGTPAGNGQAGTPGTLTVYVKVGASTDQDIVAAINGAAGSPFQAFLDPANAAGAASRWLTQLPANSVTSGGSGTAFDQTSGLQITNDGKTTNVDLSQAQTVGDLLNALQQSGTGMVAQIDASKTGIEISSRLSGPNFSIGENGGSTATQLGLRTLTAATPLADLNSGSGVGTLPAGSTGSDFTISQPDQNIQIGVSLAGLTTVGQVCDKINQLATAAGANFTAQLTSVGNGIELVDTNPNDGAITIAANAQSTAAVDLGLIPAGQTSVTSSGNVSLVGANGMTPSSNVQQLVGTDPNPQATPGIFTALQQLSQALQNNDTNGIQKALNLLDQSTQNLANVQAEVGTRQQGIDTLQQQAQTQATDIQQLLSTDYDTNVAQAASDLTAEQVAYQASLQATGSILQFTLLNYI